MTTKMTSKHYHDLVVKEEIKQEKIMKLSCELLEFIDNQDDYTRSDLQWCIEARVCRNCDFN